MKVIIFKSNMTMRISGNEKIKMRTLQRKMMDRGPK